VQSTAKSGSRQQVPEEQAPARLSDKDIPPMPQPQPSDRKPVDGRAIAIMIVLCMIWGTQQSVVKAAAPLMSPTLQLGLRSAMAALGTLAVAAWRGELTWLSRATLGPGLLIGALFGLEFVFAGEALRFTSASHVTVYLYSAPVLIAVVLGITHRDERLRPDQWLGVFIAFAGVAVTFLGRGDPGHYPAMQLGDLLALAAAVAWAMTAVVLRGSRLADAPASITLFYQLVGAGIEATAMAVALGEVTIHPAARLFVALCWLILVVAFGSYLTWFALLRRYSAARLGVLSFMTPVFGVAAGILLMGDRIDAGFALGATMILGGIVIATTGFSRKRRSNPSR
jgi:drug/metabolite transporter (DMT)-like permease